MCLVCFLKQKKKKNSTSPLLYLTKKKKKKKLLRVHLGTTYLSETENFFTESTADKTKN